eukprot:827262-Karenia_brevis.AAC.1
MYAAGESMEEKDRSKDEEQLTQRNLGEDSLRKGVYTYRTAPAVQDMLLYICLTACCLRQQSHEQ